MKYRQLLAVSRRALALQAGDENQMNRRDLARLGWATVIGAGAGKLRPAFAQSLALRQVPGPSPHPRVATLEPKARGGAADFHPADPPTPMMVELAPWVAARHYRLQQPGPWSLAADARGPARRRRSCWWLTDVPEYVQWHGFVGSLGRGRGGGREGTPPVPPHGRRRYQFVAKPRRVARWYHSHTAAMLDLHRGAYTGQFGFLMIDSANDPGDYDRSLSGAA